MLRLGVSQSHICGLAFLRLGVSQSYVWGLVRRKVWGLVIFTFGG